jgi:hypothetical protein
VTRTVMERIGPEEAAELLKLPLPGPHWNPNDRLVERMARDMSDGNWNEDFTDAIDTSGLVLHNGLHRLHAVIRSGRPQWFAVTR